MSKKSNEPTRGTHEEPMANIAHAGETIIEKNPHAAALGRLGGLKGGRARAAALTPKKRHTIAVNAAKARWKKVKSAKPEEPT